MNNLEETYENFSVRYERAEKFLKAEKGVILIGNTRAGKSTLACAAAGAEMEILYTATQQTFINPTEEPYSTYVRNTHSSVTETPNFFPQRVGFNKYAVVDMPGHADNSLLRQMVNFHYIKTMASNLNKVAFLIVINLNLIGGKLSIQDHELKMLQSFMESFPNCKENYKIIINRLQNNRKNDAEIKKFLRDTFNQLENEAMRLFFNKLVDKKIYVIEKPVYKTGPKGEVAYKTKYVYLQQKMKQILRDLSDENFIQLSLSKDWQIKKDGRRFQQFVFLLKPFILRNKELLEQSLNVLEKCVHMMVRKIKLKEKKFDDIVGEINNVLKFSRLTVQGTYNAPQTNNKLFIETEVLNFLVKLKQHQDSTAQYDEKKRLMKIREFTYFLIQVSSAYFQSASLQETLCKLGLFIERRLQQLGFIQRVIGFGAVENQHNQIQLQFLQGKKPIKIESINYKQQIKDALALCYYDAIVTISMRTNSLKTFLLDVANIKSSQQYITSFFLDMNIQQNLERYLSEYKKFKAEISQSLTILHKISDIPNQERDKIKKQANQKIKQLTAAIFITVEPENNREVQDFIVGLLQLYGSARQLKIVIKLARLFELKKEFKHSIVFYTHAVSCSDAMRLIEEHIYTQALRGNVRKDEAVEWLRTMKAEFEGKVYYDLAKKCIEMHKALANKDLEVQTELELSRLALLEQERLGNRLRQRMAQLKADKNTICDWSRIQDQVQFVKGQRIKGYISQVKGSAVLLQRYRN